MVRRGLWDRVWEDVLSGSVEETICHLQGRLVISWTSSFFWAQCMPLKKSHLKSEMSFENVLGRQPVLECKGIWGQGSAGAGMQGHLGSEVRMSECHICKSQGACTVNKTRMHMAVLRR